MAAKAALRAKLEEEGLSKKQNGSDDENDEDGPETLSDDGKGNGSDNEKQEQGSKTTKKNNSVKSVDGEDDEDAPAKMATKKKKSKNPNILDYHPAIIYRAVDEKMNLRKV